jgi:hypothetical protein
VHGQNHDGAQENKQCISARFWCVHAQAPINMLYLGALFRPKSTSHQR